MSPHSVAMVLDVPRIRAASIEEETSRLNAFALAVDRRRLRPEFVIAVGRELGFALGGTGLREGFGECASPAPLHAANPIDEPSGQDTPTRHADKPGIGATPSPVR